MISGIKKAMEECMVAVLAQYPAVQSAIVYGSRSKNKHREASDIDLALVGPELSFEMLLAIDNKMDDLLLPYKIDLCLYHMIKDSALKKGIEASGNIIYQKKT